MEKGGAYAEYLARRANEQTEGGRRLARATYEIPLGPFRPVTQSWASMSPFQPCDIKLKLRIACLVERLLNDDFLRSLQLGDKVARAVDKDGLATAICGSRKTYVLGGSAIEPNRAAAALIGRAHHLPLRDSQQDIGAVSRLAHSNLHRRVAIIWRALMDHVCAGRCRVIGGRTANLVGVLGIVPRSGRPRRIRTSRGVGKSILRSRGCWVATHGGRWLIVALPNGSNNDPHEDD